MAVEGGDEHQLKSVLAALDVLDCFDSDSELGVTEISRRLGVAKSTAHRLLSALCARGIVERVPGSNRYQLGLHLYELGQLVQDRVPLRHIALPLLEELRISTHQTVHLSVADGVDVIFIERLQTLPGIPLLGERHRRMPLHSTSAGKVLAAFNPELAEARAQAGFPALTGTTIRNAAEWKTTLAKIRKTGTAVTDGDNGVGIASVAAPVRNGGGGVVAAVSVAGPSAVIIANADRFARVVALTGSRISRRLGG